MFASPPDECGAYVLNRKRHALTCTEMKIVQNTRWLYCKHATSLIFLLSSPALHVIGSGVPFMAYVLLMVFE